LPHAAEEREALVTCPWCRLTTVVGEAVRRCDACGTVHHDACWTRHGGCGAYACAPERREAFPAELPRLRVTDDELDRAEHARTIVIPHGADLSRKVWAEETGQKRRWNRLCVASFVVSLVSIPAFGLLTGWISVLLGCIGLVLRRPKERGLVVGALSIVIGIGSSIGWAFYYFDSFPLQTVALNFDEYDIDPASLESLPDEIARPMRSNVLVKTKAGFAGFGQMIGSGVILDVASDSVLLLTNRHVVDKDFDGGRAESPPLPQNPLVVQFLGRREELPGKVVWVGPFGVDVALVRVAVNDVKDLVAACWTAELTSRVSDRVFVVGNPMGLAWSHAAGEVSQIRRQDFGPLDVRVIQTSAPVNTGNSGGGLYDQRGMIIGINTWTQDKRVAEGLGFSISFHSILELIPAEFGLPKSRLP
jgi:hypothetical protein